MYTVWGLGFGDDEDAYEHVGTYSTLQAAQNEVNAIIADSSEPEFIASCLKIETS